MIKTLRFFCGMMAIDGGERNEKEEQK
jgi:hypothetical protein